MSDLDKRKTPEFRESKKESMDRDGQKCVNCGASSDLQSHHVVPLGEGGENETSNLVTLCNACHWKLHNIGDRAEVERYTPDLLGEWVPKDDEFRNPDIWLNKGQSIVCRLIKSRGPIKRSEIADLVDYSSSTVNGIIVFLHGAGVIERVERGVYQYVPTPHGEGERYHD